MREETLRELRQVLAELELVSHVPAANLDPLPPRTADEKPGGKKPRGGVDRKDDREGGYALKSAAHFRRRLDGALARNRLREEDGEPPSNRALEAILADARRALAAHKRQPPPPDRPELSSPQWKRWVAESQLPANKIASLYNVSRSYVERVRARYAA